MPAPPRLYCPEPLHIGATIALPAGAARHVQVLRLQPGDPITLFGGTALHTPSELQSLCGGEFQAAITHMGRSAVQCVIEAHTPVEREAARAVHLAIGMPANERMDWLVEKATELGAASIQPLMTERSVVRLEGDRASKKSAHWSGIAIAACEQCGRNTLPTVYPIRTLTAWMRASAAPLPGPGVRLVLSLQPQALPLREAVAQGRLPNHAVTLLSGPEGGLSAAEEHLALQQGFAPVSLGERVLRAETAALMALTLLA